MPTTLIVTNDFPPRVGGIESFVGDVADLLDGDVVVYTSSARNSGPHDRSLGYEVVRAGPVLLPTPARTRQAVQLLRRSGASRVLFGAAAPLGLMAPALRRAGAQRIVALTHGHEVWWATLPGSRSLLRRVGDTVDQLGAISDYTAARIGSALTPAARSRMVRLAPPVDTALFHPGELTAPGSPRRAIAVGRLVRQKGFETLLRAWRLVLDRWSAAERAPELVLVGDGPGRRRLSSLARDLKLGSTVRMLGAMPRAGVVEQLQQSHVFVLPVRTRLAGLNPEGLGLAGIEAAACGLPVLLGRSGGAPETVLDGRTGFVVEPDAPEQLASKLAMLLTAPVLSQTMGAAGRRFVSDTFGTAQARQTLRLALALRSTDLATARPGQHRASGAPTRTLRPARGGVLSGERHGVAELTSASIDIAAAPSAVLAVIENFSAYPEWVSSITATEVLTSKAGRPATVRMVLEHPLVSDDYVLAYDWAADLVSWKLVQATLLKAMDGSYALTRAGSGTRVTYTLTVDVTMPMIGMFKRKAEKTIIDGALKGLKQRVEG
ncbi:MAG TPA: glycosyltransferase [Propionibacteriaceae bacterium]